MPENKDKLTEKKLLEHLDFMFDCCKSAASRFGKPLYPPIEQTRTQLKVIVRESENWYDEDGEFLHLPDILDAHKKFIKQQKPIVTRTEIENAVGDTSDEYTEGVIELFESKGFTVETGK